MMLGQTRLGQRWTASRKKLSSKVFLVTKNLNLNQLKRLKLNFRLVFVLGETGAASHIHDDVTRR